MVLFSCQWHFAVILQDWHTGWALNSARGFMFRRRASIRALGASGVSLRMDGFLAPTACEQECDCIFSQTFCERPHLLLHCVEFCSRTLDMQSSIFNGVATTACPKGRSVRKSKGKTCVAHCITKSFAPPSNVCATFGGAACTAPPRYGYR
jgi:hypothetical protein